MSEPWFWHVTETGLMLGVKSLMSKTCLEGILVEQVKWNLEQNPLFFEPYAHVRVFYFTQDQLAKQAWYWYSREW